MHTTVALLAIMALGGPQAPGQTTEAHIKHCLVSSIQEVQVPAAESGPLTLVTAKEGMPVKTDALLAQIDDRQARLDKEAAEAQRDAALAQAADDVEIRFAKASFDVSDAELQQNLDINQRSPGSVPLSEIRRLRLTKHKAELQIDRARLDTKVTKLTADVEQSKVKSALGAVQRRQIISPIGGTVIAIHHQQGEWIDAGEPLVHIVKMDELYVEGFLSAAEHNPSEISDREVSVIVPLARGRQVQLAGSVVFVSPVFQAGNKYRIRAKVKNQQENKQWLLRPGSTAEMTIHFRKRTATPRFNFPR